MVLIMSDGKVEHEVNSWFDAGFALDHRDEKGAEAEGKAFQSPGWAQP